MKLGLIFLMAIFSIQTFAGEGKLWSCEAQDQSVNNVVVEISEDASQQLQMKIDFIPYPGESAVASKTSTTGALVFEATYKDGGHATLSISTGSAPRKVKNKIVRTGRLTVDGVFNELLMDCSL